MRPGTSQALSDTAGSRNTALMPSAGTMFGHGRRYRAAPPSTPAWPARAPAPAARRVASPRRAARLSGHHRRGSSARARCALGGRQCWPPSRHGDADRPDRSDRRRTAPHTSHGRCPPCRRPRPASRPAASRRPVGATLPRRLRPRRAGARRRPRCCAAPAPRPRRPGARRAAGCCPSRTRRGLRSPLGHAAVGVAPRMTPA